MKLKILVILPLLFSLNSCGQYNIKKSTVEVEKEAINSEQQEIITKAKRLKELYQKASSSSNDVTIYYNQFFEEFPANFQEFIKIYGYEEDGDNTKYGILYDESYNHVCVLYKKIGNSIPPNEYYNKLINLCIGGFWQSDGVSCLEMVAKEFIQNNTKSFIEILSKRNTKEIQSFWHFYFDGPHPPEVIPKELEGIKQLNSQIYQLMEAVLKAVQEDWKDH